jgi:hypothetical protein
MQNPHKQPKQPTNKQTNQKGPTKPIEWCYWFFGGYLFRLLLINPTSTPRGLFVLEFVIILLFYILLLLDDCID